MTCKKKQTISTNKLPAHKENKRETQRQKYKYKTNQDQPATKAM